MERQRALTAVAIILAFLLAEIPFGLAGWVAVGRAPEGAGNYSVLIQATYDRIHKAVFPLRLVVNETRYEQGNLTIEPVYPIPRTTPVTLRYDIHLDGSYDFNMVSNRVTVYYASEKNALRSEEGGLQNVGSYWETTVDVPLKGEYEAVISIAVEKGGKIYGGQFLAHFSSDAPSENLLLSHSVSKRVLLPAESFTVSMDAVYEDAVLPGLDMFKAYIYGDLKTLAWDSVKHDYRAAFTAPRTEGIYKINMYAEGQGSMAQENLYVVELARPKSGRCPVVASGGCTDMKDVRRCVADWKSGTIQLTEDQIAQCFETAAGGVTYGTLVCNAQYKGDVDGDLAMTPTDLDLMQNLIMPLSASQRREYAKCADYDRDGDVDNDDLRCMTNVLAKKWYGDLNGGICFDATYDSPLKGDLDGNKFVQNNDAIMLRDIVGASKAGIAVPQPILGTADFDQDGRLGQRDLECLDYFVGMELANPNTLLAYGQTIPADCMKIYRLDRCQKIRGDLNGDLRIDSVDEILVMLAYQRQITGYDLACADVNKELGVTLEDVECVKSYTGGDRDYYFTCIGCNENTPTEYRAEYEICGDGYDNNCDGLVDRTSENPDADWCRCIAETPCWMVSDNDQGLIPGIADANVKVCRKVSWDESSAMGSGGAVSEYKWRLPVEFICGEDKSCEYVECKDTRWTCAFDGFEWKWYDKPKDLPAETEDPMALPKLCDDGYDNDCLCGDKKCAELEQGNMFTSWQFWAGFIAGALVAWFCPPCATYLFYISIAMTVATFFVDDPGLKAAMSGFSMGVSIGSMASSMFGPAHALKAAEASVSKAATEAAKATTKELGKEAGTEAGKAAIKKAAEEAAKKAAVEIAKKTGTKISTDLAAKLASKSVETLAASKSIMTSVMNSVKSFAHGLLTGSSTMAKLALGVAVSQGVQHAAMDYAQSKAEWVSRESGACAG